MRVLKGETFAKKVAKIRSLQLKLNSLEEVLLVAIEKSDVKLFSIFHATYRENVLHWEKEANCGYKHTEIDYFAEQNNI